MLRSKKVIVLLCMMLLTCGFSIRGSMALDDIDLNPTNFPDSNFLLLLKGYDTNGDNKLDSTELSNITALTINSPIEDITGVKLLSSLSNLKISNTANIKTIDVSNLASLKAVSSNGNDNITSVDVSNCSSLTNVSFPTCHNIASLNLKGSTAITNLSVSGNEDSSFAGGVNHCKLASIDLSDQVNLEYLNTRCCSLTSLDISNNTKIKSIDTCNNHFCYIKGLDKIEGNPGYCARLQTVKMEAVQTKEGLVVDFSKYPGFLTDAFSASDGGEIEGVSYNPDTGLMTVSDPTKTVSGVYKKGGVYVYSTFTFSILYEVNFIVEGKVVSTQRVKLNASAKVPTGISKEGYTFIGFDKDTSNITGPINTSAVFKALPTIKAQNKTIDENTSFDPYSYVEGLDCDGNSLKIKIINNDVNNKKAGTYHITYQVIDKWGGKANKTITVTVNKQVVIPVTPAKIVEPKKEPEVKETNPSITVSDVTKRKTVTPSTPKNKPTNKKIITEKTSTYQTNGQGFKNLSNDLKHFFDSDCIIHIIILIMGVIYLILALLNKFILKNKKIFSIFSILFILASVIVYTQGKCSLDIITLFINIIIAVLFLTIFKIKENNEKEE